MQSQDPKKDPQRHSPAQAAPVFLKPMHKPVVPSVSRALSSFVVQIYPTTKQWPRATASGEEEHGGATVERSRL